MRDSSHIEQRWIVEGTSFMNEPIAVGAPAPDFTLKSSTGEDVNLSALRGQKVVLAFYPFDWSGVCTKQMDDYSANLAQFQAEGAQVLGISIDSPYSHRAWAETRGLGFPLLADFHPKGAVAQAYGVYNAEGGFAKRAIIVVDESGVVRSVEMAKPGEFPESGMVCDVLRHVNAA
jgi:peroxiredoxin